MNRRIHLICNAHLDPVWLWEWQEGAAEALSTFRTAADLCEEFDSFVFNHNEAVLYQWVEQYEPALFRRIQRLVKKGKWHIMGGWYLQPDCNMPSGESFVRQVLVGRTYFQEKFGAAPTTAINFDPFGHSRGLVQILAKSGYDSYLFARPDEKWTHLPGDEFVWVGFDGSRVLGYRARGHYPSPLGGAREKVRKVLDGYPAGVPVTVLWGVGNHGGGPSRADLRDLTAMIAGRDDLEIFHSTPEAYFKELARMRGRLGEHADDINPWAVGCYTSQVRVKQAHRRLENELYATEKMVAAAWAQRLMPYPADQFAEATRDLLFTEFHDVLPGSSIQPAEAASLRKAHHGLEILSRLKARALFALSAGQPRAKKGEIPVLVYNPHPYAVRRTVECEFQLADQNWVGYMLPRVSSGRRQIPSQVEKEESNLALDWRKRVVFAAELGPGMNRFDCRLERVARRPVPRLKGRNGRIRFRTDDLEFVINTRTGLVDRWRAGGQDVATAGAFALLVMADNEDPWGMTVRSFRKPAGRFRLLSRKDAARFAGVRAGALAPVRVIEEGAVRTVVEALFGYGDSRAALRYKLPKRGAEIEVELHVHWNEKSRCLKLSVPTAGGDAEYLGQTAYGIQPLPNNGDEAVAQKWVAVVGGDPKWTLTCINDGSYGSDFAKGEMRLTLLRSPAYAGHPIMDRSIVVQDRYVPQVDQGERIFRFWLNAGPASRRLQAVGREAQVHNEKPMALSFFPAGAGSKPKPLVLLGDDVVELSAAKKSHRGGDLVVRLFEPTGRKRSTVLSVPPLRIRRKVALGGFEVKTFRINLRTRTVTEVDLLERKRRR